VHPQPENYVGHVNPNGPRACYDEGKRAAETMFCDYRRLFGLEVKIARIFNTYGPRMNPDDGRVVEGLSHITFIVRNLDRMEEILVSVLGARKVYDSGDETFSVSRERFFLAGEEPTQVWLAIMEGDSLPTQTYNHIAFKISEANYHACLERVQGLGLEVREGRSRVAGEGRSIYFHDDDNHLFELHTGTLTERLQRYARAKK
jgi:catechol 2,3-dioxygenase-like lactoylglutathione lyase family enzyme